MPFCSKCGTNVADGMSFCPACGTVMIAAAAAGSPAPAPALGAGVRPTPASSPAGIPLKQETSGKAVASLVLGIFPVIPLVGSILAIVFGHMSRGEIRRSAGRLKGEGIALAGLILGYLGVAVLPFILIIAAIAIPNLLRARLAANQASAVGSLRIINVAEATYATTYATGFSRDLSSLGGDGKQPSKDSARLIDSILAGGTKSGYRFTYTAGPSDQNGGVTTYTVQADPIVSGNTGENHYFTDQTGVIRQETGRPADSNSPPLGG